MLISSHIIRNLRWTLRHQKEREQIAAPLAEPVDFLSVLVYSPSSDSSSSELDLPIAHRKGRHSTANTQPIYTSLSYSHVSSPYVVFLSSLDSVFTPKSVTEALSHLGWEAAMKEEYQVARQNILHTSSVTLSPPAFSNVQ